MCGAGNPSGELARYEYALTTPIGSSLHRILHYSIRHVHDIFMQSVLPIHFSRRLPSRHRHCLSILPRYGHSPASYQSQPRSGPQNSRFRLLSRWCHLAHRFEEAPCRSWLWLDGPGRGLACLTIRPPVNSARRSSPQRRSMEVSVFKNPTLILMSLSLSFIYMGLFTPFFYVTPYTVSLGLGANMAFYMISILNAASLFGHILPGILADWYGSLNMFNSAAALSFIIIFRWTKATSIAGIAVFSLAYGFFSSSVVSLMSACAIQRVEPAQNGAAIGFAMSILSIGYALLVVINFHFCLLTMD